MKTLKVLDFNKNPQFKFTLTLNNSDELIIEANTKTNLPVKFQAKFTNKNLPRDQDGKETPLRKFIQDIQFEILEDQIKFQVSDIGGMLKLPLEQTTYHLRLRQIQNSEIKPVEKKNLPIVVGLKKEESQQLKKLQQQEQKLDLQRQQLQSNFIKQDKLKKQLLERIKDINQNNTALLKQVAQLQNQFQEAKKKYVPNPIQKHPKYGKHVEKQNGKEKLFMRDMKVNDEMIKEIVSCDFSKVQILSLGDNQITDKGFNSLFENKQWPILSEIYLQNNQIKNIKHINNFMTLETLVVYENDLSEASCDFFCEYYFPDVKNFRLSFATGLNKKCWKRIVAILPQKFPNLQELYYSHKEDLDQQIMQEILVYCNSKNISLNHSLNKDGLEKLLTLQLLAGMIKN